VSDSVDLEVAIKQLIIDSLMLEDLTVAEIESDAPLFIEGLGLDSIDALELAMALKERFGVQIQDDPDANREIFASVKSLTAFLVSQRGPNGGAPV
jgi:acyl carrier protein